MTRHVYIPMALVLLVGTGCARSKAEIEADARKLVVPASMPGGVMGALTGTSEKMLADKRIDSAHRVKTKDGVEIDVWVINSRLQDATSKSTVTRGTVVMLHPLMTGKTWFLGHAEKLALKGWDVVLMDLRAHGRSGGEFVTWGAREKYDVKAVVDELLTRKTVHKDIYVCGASLGGAVAIQYAAIDPRCKGVLAFAPPTGIRGIGRRILLMLSDKDFETALTRAGEIADFDPADASTVTAAGKLTCPLILVHGRLDLIVPYDHSEAILKAAPNPKRLISLPLDGHASEIAREGWLTKQMAALADMGRERKEADEKRLGSKVENRHTWLQKGVK